MNLLFIKKRSKRYASLWIKVYLLRLLAVGIIGIIGYGLFKILIFFNSFDGLNNLFLSTILAYIVYRMIVPFITKYFSDGVVHSLGDVVKYTVPLPQNVAVRNKIRKKGIDLLTKLHEAKRSDGLPQYERIILVGHSLGSIICYDLLTHLFPQFQHTYDAEKIANSEEAKMQTSLNELEEIANRKDFDPDDFQTAQSNLLNPKYSLGKYFLKNIVNSLLIFNNNIPLNLKILM